MEEEEEEEEEQGQERSTPAHAEREEGGEGAEKRARTRVLLSAFAEELPQDAAAAMRSAPRAALLPTPRSRGCCCCPPLGIPSSSSSACASDGWSDDFSPTTAGLWESAARLYEGEGREGCEKAVKLPPNRMLCCLSFFQCLLGLL